MKNKYSEGHNSRECSERKRKNLRETNVVMSTVYVQSQLMLPIDTP